MHDWTLSSIRDLLDREFAGEWGQEPQHEAPLVTVFRSTDFDEHGHLDHHGGVLRTLSPQKVAAKSLRPGDILLEASGGTPDRAVGRVARYDGGNDGPTVAANFLRTLRPSPSVSSEFLYWKLLYLHTQSAIWRYQQQTTGIINLKVSDYLRHRIAHPSSTCEQERIAEILSTVDEAIEQTEALIAKTQQIKAGLMHDLFTRGVTPDGQLRPPREEAPQLYKESPLGWIPKDWQTELLDTIALRGSGHTPNKNHAEYWNGGVKWVSLADSWRLDRVHISDTDHSISQLGIENSSAVRHPPGTVVLSRDAGVGKSAILAVDMAVSQHFMCWRCGPRLDKYYLYYWLQHRKWEFENIATGSTIPTIGLRFFRRYQIKITESIAEQQTIGATLLAADERTYALEEDREKLRQLKAGLMDDLLTGRVRVETSPATTKPAATARRAAPPSVAPLAAGSATATTMKLE